MKKIINDIIIVEEGIEKIAYYLEENGNNELLSLFKDGFDDSDKFYSDTYIRIQTEANPIFGLENTFSVIYTGLFNKTDYQLLLSETSFRKTYLRDFIFWPLISTIIISFTAYKFGLSYFFGLLLIPLGFFTSSIGFFAFVLILLLIYSIYSAFTMDFSLLLLSMVWYINHSAILNLKKDYKNFVENLCINSEACMKYWYSFKKQILILKN